MTDPIYVRAGKRQAVLERDGQLCQICKVATATEIDHIWPKAKGGTADLANLQAACKPCNRAKRDWVPTEDQPHPPTPRVVVPVAWSSTGGADPVGVREIAERLGVQRQTVAMWNLRGMLPDPPWVVSGHPAWDWPIVEQWAKETGRLR